MGAAKGGGAGLGQAEMLDLAFGDQRLHGRGDLLDWRLRIDTMLVEQIDRLDLQPLERSFHRSADTGRAGIDANLLAGIGIDVETKFGGDHHGIAERRRASPTISSLV